MLKKQVSMCLLVDIIFFNLKVRTIWSLEQTCGIAVVYKCVFFLEIGIWVFYEAMRSCMETPTQNRTSTTINEGSFTVDIMSMRMWSK